MSREQYQVELTKIMPKAIRVLTAALDSVDEKLAVGAARYIIDQVMGKPTQNVNDPGALAAGAGAAMLAQVLQQHLMSQPAPARLELPEGVEIVEGAVHILNVVDTTDFPEES
jgi:hypothetical protein